jgi:MOSC domain-containing protein YiiM
VSARIFQLARSSGGVPKHGVSSARVTELGLEGDEVKHTNIHGGPDRALCLYSLELIEKLQSEGHPIFPGSTGENVTIGGLDWSLLHTGTRLRLGDSVLVELTKTADPCKTIKASFAGGTFSRLRVDGEMRWYCKVLQAGVLRVGQPVEVARS